MTLLFFLVEAVVILGAVDPLLEVEHVNVGSLS